MGFKDSVSGFAKSVGNKTNEVVEVTKLKTKVTNENAIIKSNFEKIGEYIYNQYKSGDFDAIEIKNLFLEIDNSIATISNLRAEIERTKGENY